MDEEYVQEHILTGGIVAPVGGDLTDSFMAAYSQFARRCRVIPDTFATCSALRACVVRAGDWLHRRRKPPPCSMGGCSRCAGGKPLLRGDMTEQGCKLMATMGVVVNGLGNLGSVLPAASALAKRHIDYGVKAADARWRGAAVDVGAGFRITMSEPLVIVGNGMAATGFWEELAQRALGRYAVSVIGEEPRLADV